MRQFILGTRKVVSESEIKTRMSDEEFEVLSVTKRLMGNDRFMVRYLDSSMRLCRIEAKMRRKVWIRINDIVIVTPWDFQSDKRRDITYWYQRNQTDWLKSNEYENALSTVLGA